MNRRRLLTLAPAGIAASMLKPYFAWAQASPIAEPDIPLAYGDVANAYEAARQRALTEGRLLGDQIFGGDVAAAYARTSADLQSALTAPQIEAMLAQLLVDRLSFAAPELGFFFDGQLAGETVDGFLMADVAYGFAMQRDARTGSPIPETTPYDGNWNGQIDLGGQVAAMVVTLAGDEGTIAFPELGIESMPLSGIAFDPERPVGARIADQGLPYTRGSVAYWGRYAWGDRSLSLAAAIENDGTVSLVQVAPEPQLPPDPAAGFVSDVTYRLPFDGLWWVFWGGASTLENYHAIDQRQRHALDLLIWNEGATFRTDGAANADYWIYGQPVVAPADGEVVEIMDGAPENQPGSTLPDQHPGGNHVVLRTAPEEFVMLAHMQPGSLSVAKGDRVTAGQQIGLVGNSGNSSEPHLHIHLQNEADFFSATAIGLPLVFHDLMVNGERAERALLEQGSFVSMGRAG